MSFQRVVSLLALALAAGGFGSPAQNWDWDAADRAVVRLSPAQFPYVPAPIRRELERQGCTIPQPPGERNRNVVRGRFVRKDEIDWAVLCSVNRVSRILVFRGSSPAVFAELVRHPDLDLLQGDGDGRIAFSRGLAAVGRETILKYQQMLGAGERLPPLDHQGLEDAFIGKASTILYYYRGKWLELQGAD